MTTEHDDEQTRVDPRLAVTWERLLKLARGSADVVEVLLPVAAGLTRDELARLLGRAASRQKAEALDALEQVWRLLGVVPRYRYEELMERYGTLRRRVEEAERGLSEVQRTMQRAEREADAKDALDAWGALVRRTISGSAGIVRSVAGSIELPAPPAAELPPAPEPEPRPAPRRRPTPRKKPAARTRTTRARKPPAA
jgi:hypothetical protein